MATRSLRSSVVRAENEQAAAHSKLAVKTRTAGGGLRTVLNAVSQNVIVKPDARDIKAKVGLKPSLNIVRRTQNGAPKILAARSVNAAKQQAVVPAVPKSRQSNKENVRMDVDVDRPASNLRSKRIIGTPILDISECHIEDIDADDKDNPQLVYDYVNEIHSYLMHLEVRQCIAAAYLSEKGATIKPKMRNLLIDWLVDVHQQFSLLQETLYLTVAVVDRYLQTYAGKRLNRQDLQLVGVTALFVAAKYEEMYPPEISDFVYIADHAYSDEQIREMEVTLLCALNFNLGRPLPINFLRRYSKAGSVEAKTHGLAKYVMELSIVEYEMSHLAPSLLAAASLALSMFLMADGRTDLSTLWTPTLVHYSTYHLRSLFPVIRQLALLVVLVHQEETAAAHNLAPSTKKVLPAIPKKYGAKKFLHVAEMTALQRSGPLLSILSARYPF